MPGRRGVLLAVGSGRRSRGYGRVLASLLPGVSRAFETVHFAIDLAHAPPSAGWAVEPNGVPGDLAGAERIGALLERHRPAVVWICHDWWVWQRLAPALRACRPRPRVVVYSPVDPALLDAADLDGLSLLVAYTETARRKLAAAVGTAVALDRVPHGVDTATFRPL
ncbi:MAG TPA: hypothetical protein VGX28_11800, partial [Frankiaceae bacterium]|nr:hypothetical protein [Frankiaceae bacterium]